MQLKDFDYHLPNELIARYPLSERSASRLLVLNGQTGELAHHHFPHILTLLTPNDLLIFNNTKVIPARFFAQKETGGRIEILVERILDDKRFLAQIRASKSPKPQQFILAEDIRFETLNRVDNLFELYCHDPRKVIEVIENIGQIPLPPYMERSPEESDKERYQTIYAKEKGSVAAPTAGLHFDESLFQALSLKGIETAYLTLHVGAGTFAPVRVAEINQHKMHPEYLEVSVELCEKIKKTQQRSGKIVAVGTTTARSLETASRSGNIQPFKGNTDIFIYPGFEFKCLDALITNLHVPCSTLLMLVSAFAGYEHTMQAYQEAVNQSYRFYSYGDAMFITKK